MNLTGRLGRDHRTPELEAAARGRRALDHLARKRERERQRLERARRVGEIRQSRRRFFAVAGPLFFVGALYLGAVYARPVTEALLLRDTALERVSVHGASRLSAPAIAAATGALAGRPLRQVDPESIGQALGDEPWIESARVLRLPTGTLIVQVVERQAVARWHIAEAEGVELVDHKGSRFSGAVKPGGPLPLVRGKTDASGELPKEALEILQATQQHAPLARRPAALTLHLPGLVTTSEGAVQGSPSGYVLELGREGPRALLGRRFLAQRVARLAALLEDDPAMVQAARLIDLRYADRAVLRTEPASG